MPSFDIVSEVDRQEVDNAINQAKKELTTRFDFKDAKAEIILEKDLIKLSALNQYKLNALEEIVIAKLAKRNVSLKNVDQQDPAISPLGHATQEIKIKQGIEGDEAKKIVAFIKESKLKVQAAIQEKQIRVTGKNRDDLQAVMNLLRGKEFDVALGFTNFRP
ncbi:MAG: YajQ family cyclic di-GMP-binding protein [Candidatus Methylacidiphilales bacterium]|nr:YajQ family cyclic di-GMP-binding protein [Candidatus Methylacidiphilales bacterium]